MSSSIIIRAKPAGGKTFRELVWRKVKIKKSLDEICHSLELELPVSERHKIHKHDTVEVRYYNQYISESEQNNKMRRVTTVLVDEITDVTDIKQKSLTVIGRSPARDIIDSSWPDTIKGQTLEELTLRIAKKFDILVARFPKDGPKTWPVNSFSWEDESPWTKLVNEADNQGYIFTSNKAGNLYLWKVASTPRREGFFLEEGKNIRNIQTTENGGGQYHEYVVKGAGRKAIQIDGTCKNKRVLTINLTDFSVSEESLRRRALTEMLRRRENRTTVTVTGWGLTDRQIQALGNTFEKEIFWNPNFLIPVSIPSSGLNDNLLISEVEYEADASVMICTLTLVNREAYT
jgi:prophage tail gpP-like protein